MKKLIYKMLKDHIDEIPYFITSCMNTYSSKRFKTYD